MKKKKMEPPASRPTLHGEDEFREWLRKQCAASSGKEVAAAAGIDPSQLSALIAGRGALGPGTVARFGYRRRTIQVFEPIEDDSGKKGSP